MGLCECIEFTQGLPDSFEDDTFSLTNEMQEKYKNSVITIVDGQMGTRPYFCKNASIFDVAGRKICWGNIGPNDVKQMKGVYYILSEGSSFWNADPQEVNGYLPLLSDARFPAHRRSHLPNFEPVVFNVSYVKRHAFARIIDGKIQTNKNLVLFKY